MIFIIALLLDTMLHSVYCLEREIVSLINESRNVYKQIVEEYKKHKDSKVTERLLWKTFAPIDLDLAEVLLQRYKFDASYEVDNPTSKYEQIIATQIKAGYII